MDPYKPSFLREHLFNVSFYIMLPFFPGKHVLRVWNSDPRANIHQQVLEHSLRCTQPTRQIVLLIPDSPGIPANIVKARNSAIAEGSRCVSWKIVNCCTTGCTKNCIWKCLQLVSDCKGNSRSPHCRYSIGRTSLPVSGLSDGESIINEYGVKVVRP